MEIGKTLYAPNGKAWRAWLKKHHAKEQAIWLIYPKKHTGKARVPYNDAVDEALCFGWIDSTAKRIDDDRYAQRFTPRRKTSGLSQMNKERVRKLIANGKMTKAGLAAIAHAYRGKADHGKAKVSGEIVKALKKEGNAWKHFQKFPESYKRIRIAYIEDCRGYSAELFQKRLANFVRNTAKNKRFGFVRE